MNLGAHLFGFYLVAENEWRYCSLSCLNIRSNCGNLALIVRWLRRHALGADFWWRTNKSITRPLKGRLAERPTDHFCVYGTRFAVLLNAVYDCRTWCWAQPIGVYTTGTHLKKRKKKSTPPLSLTLWPAAAPFAMKREKDLPWIEYDKAAWLCV